MVHTMFYLSQNTVTMKHVLYALADVHPGRPKHPTSFFWRNLFIPGQNPRYWHTYADEDSMKWAKSHLVGISFAVAVIHFTATKNGF